MDDILNKYAETNAKKKIRCPLTEEKDPSFSYKDDYFKCFSCGEQGTQITFVQKLFKITYPEALMKIDTDFHLGVYDKKNIDVEHVAKIEAKASIKNKKREYEQQKEEEREDLLDEMQRVEQKIEELRPTFTQSAESIQEFLQEEVKLRDMYHLIDELENTLYKIRKGEFDFSKVFEEEQKETTLTEEVKENNINKEKEIKKMDIKIKGRAVNTEKQTSKAKVIAYVDVTLADKVTVKDIAVIRSTKEDGTESTFTRFPQFQYDKKTEDGKTVKAYKNVISPANPQAAEILNSSIMQNLDKAIAEETTVSVDMEDDLKCKLSSFGVLDNERTKAIGTVKVGETLYVNNVLLVEKNNSDEMFIAMPSAPPYENTEGKKIYPSRFIIQDTELKNELQKQFTQDYEKKSDSFEDITNNINIAIAETFTDIEKDTDQQKDFTAEDDMQF